jgi:death-on-curing protein
VVVDMGELIFLTLAEVIEIHNDQVERYGGHPGLRDNELLCSAVAMPETSFNETYLHNGFIRDGSRLYLSYM